jgi:hypothetical protein
VELRATSSGQYQWNFKEVVHYTYNGYDVLSIDSGYVIGTNGEWTVHGPNEGIARGFPDPPTRDTLFEAGASFERDRDGYVIHTNMSFFVHGSGKCQVQAEWY